MAGQALTLFLGFKAVFVTLAMLWTNFVEIVPFGTVNLFLRDAPQVQDATILNVWITGVTFQDTFILED